MKAAEAGEAHAHPVSERSFFTRMREVTGTVYGDIGTSVLYTVTELFRETVRLKHSVGTTVSAEALLDKGGALLSSSETLGALSLIYWALIFLTIKYDFIIMRADNRGEGGTFALWGLLKGYTGKIFGLGFIGYLVVGAAGLLAADGIITPPISMLGAYEPLGESAAVLATLVSLFVLFKSQWRGTSSVGSLFGWFMMFVWFPWIAIKGVPHILHHPEVFQAVDPRFAAAFLGNFPSVGAFVILGIVVLAITGGEAKYADIGHFTRAGHRRVQEGESLDPVDSGRRPVMFAWLAIVLPSLLCNYAGQAGYVLEHGVPPRANTFFALTPKTGDPSVDQVILGVDMVISAIAAFIASQALITGLFSIVKQAIAFGFCPRFDVRATSREAEGQVYIPVVNWALFVSCVAVTILFRSADNLAAAYGIAVTGTMGITTLTFAYVAHYRWKWSVLKSAVICLPILAIDLLFFSSNLLKFSSGGYVPVAVAAVLVAIMLTWQWGRAQLLHALGVFSAHGGKTLRWLVGLREQIDAIALSSEESSSRTRTLAWGKSRLVESDRAYVFFCPCPIHSVDENLPVVLRIFLEKYGVLPCHVILFHIHQLSVAEADDDRRFEVLNLGRNIDYVAGTYGYMEHSDIRAALRELERQEKTDVPSERWIIDIGEENLMIDEHLPFFRRARAHLFRMTFHLATPVHRFLGLQSDPALSKELIPIVFSGEGATVDLPELAIADAHRAS